MADLPAPERLRLVENIWDSLGASTAEVPAPDWHRDELDDPLEPARAASRSPRTAREIEHAYPWYEGERIGLAARFKDELL